MVTHPPLLRLDQDEVKYQVAFFKSDCLIWLELFPGSRGGSESRTSFFFPFVSNKIQWLVSRDKLVPLPNLVPGSLFVLSKYMYLNPNSMICIAGL